MLCTECGPSDIGSENTNDLEHYQMNGEMPDGYEFWYDIYTEHCCGNASCVLGSVCKCSLATYVRLGIIHETDNNNNTEIS